MINISVDSIWMWTQALHSCLQKKYQGKTNHYLSSKTTCTLNWTGLISSFLCCAVPENIHTPPTEGIGISWGVGGSLRPQN